MAIEKYKNNKKQVRFRAIVFFNGKKISTKRGFEKIRDAEVWHNQRQIDLLKDPTIIDLKDLSFEKLVEKFREYYIPKLKTQTQDRYIYDLQKIEPFFKYYRLKQISTQLVSEFQTKLLNTKVYSGRGTINSPRKIDALKKKGIEIPYKMMAPKSINHCIGVLSTMFSYSIDLGWLEKNPVKKIKRLKVENKGLVWWRNEEDITKFLEEVKRSTDYFAFYLTTLQTGLRLGELAALKKSDFDYKQRTLSINEQWNCKHQTTDSLKGNQPRVVSINEELAEILKKESKKSQHPILIFSTSTGGRINAKTLASRTFYQLMERASVPRINFHALRHTYSFHYIRNGGNIRWLQENLGHQFIETTEQYAHQIGVKDDSSVVNFLKKNKRVKDRKAAKVAKIGEDNEMSPKCPQEPLKLRLVQ